MLKFEKGEKLVLASSSPKIVGKGFTVGTKIYEISQLPSAPHGQGGPVESYAVIINDSGVKVSFWKNDIMENFADPNDNLKTAVQNVMPAPPTGAVPAPPTGMPLPGPIMTSPMAMQPTGLVDPNVIIAKMEEDNKVLTVELMNKTSTIEDLTANTARLNQDLLTLRNDYKKLYEIHKELKESSNGAQASNQSNSNIFEVLDKLNVMRKMTVITVIKNDAGNTISVKVDDLPGLTITSTNSISSLSQEIELLLNESFSPNMIRIQTIQEFSKQLEALEGSKKKELTKETKAADGSEVGTAPTGKGKRSSTKPLMTATAPVLSDDAPPEPMDDDMPPEPAPDETIDRIASLEKRSF